MVLHHVAQYAVVIEVAAAVLHPERLGDGNLYAVHVAAIPIRLEDHVGETENHDVLHGLLPEVMIDAVDLRLLQELVQFVVEFAGRIQVATEGFFDDDPAVALGSFVQETGGAKLRGDCAEESRRHGQIKDHVLSRDFPLLLHAGDFFLQSGENGGVVEIAGDVVAGG